MKKRAPALPDLPNFHQLWDALGSKLIDAAQENLLYTQGGRGSSTHHPTYIGASPLRYLRVIDG